MMRKLVGQLLGVAILFGFLFGLVVLVFMPFELLRMAEARSWPFREGVVTKSVVSPQGSFRKTFWEPVIRGTYRDTGEEFWVSRVRYGEFKTRTGKASAEADIARYRPGTIVRVYFSPANPKETLLEPFAPWTTMIVMSIVGATGLLLPVVLFLVRKRAPSS